MDKMLQKQIARIRRKYPEEEFEERLFEVVSESYANFEKVQKLRDRSIKLMSDELLTLYEESKHKSEAFISAILGNIVDGLITCDISGKVITANESAQQILDVSEEETTGTQLEDILNEYNSFDHLISDLLDNQKEVCMKGRVRSKIACELSVSRMDFDEVAYIVIFRDVTERKKYEQTIITEKEKAEKASLAKAEFLSVMSHEIRTPMNSIIGMTNLLLEDEIHPERKKLLDTLKFSSEHLLTLINDILDFNKIEAGKIEFEQVDFNVKELIEKLVASNKYQADENNLSLSFLWDTSLTEYVVGDPSRLAQILTNLMSNALKFTLEGSVEVIAKKVSEDVNSEKVSFEIKDTGIGISQDKLNVIFDSFSQSETYTTRKFGGTGLGLAITKQLVNLQDGDIRVKSVLGEGSSFCFELTFEKSQIKKTNIDKSALLRDLVETKLSGAKILVVEDHPLNQIVIRKLLHKWNCEIDIVEDGNKALEQIEHCAYDIVLMDLQMPNKDGFEATREIRSSIKPYKDIPIIALTASAFLEEKKRAINAGVNDFITKPFNPNDLLEKISKNLLAASN